MVFTTAQAADRLGITRERVDQLINEGTLNASRVGYGWLVDEEDLAQYQPRPVERPDDDSRLRESLTRDTIKIIFT